MWVSRSIWLRVGLLWCVPAGVGDVGQIRPDAPGFRITTNARVAPGIYKFQGRTEEGAVIIAGDGITVDFQGATLIGAAADADPDSYVGKGLVVRGRNVTVLNARIRGYKVGIYVEDSPGLTLRGCDVSRNYRQRLNSTIRYEDFSDWLFGHENDKNEWLRYGAGIYLLRCPDATVVQCRARNGQNGLCVSRCDRARIVDNDMSFMSGWGLAMWRSSRCEVFNNKFDWCMRGYSHGVYSRGQDSAGILVYEQCNDNLIAYNSATHSGDGFFLYAGNETVKRTGSGGCNGNIVYRNDFSHAAANGIEATFSARNIFIENTLRDCHHGVWAGYSYDTIVENNVISDCTYGVSIEHGHDNLIAGNRISDTQLGVQLWWDDDKNLLASPFGKKHNRCPSDRNRVIANRFQRVGTAIRLADDTNAIINDNTMTSVGTSVHLAGNVDGAQLVLAPPQRTLIRSEGRGSISYELADPPAGQWKPTDLSGGDPELTSKMGEQDAFLPDGARRGRESIFIDQWGPYDFTDVRVFPSRILSGPRGLIQLLGPGSDFHVTKLTGNVKVTPTSGQLPRQLTVEASEKGLHAFVLDISAEGQTHRASGVLLNADWRVEFYAWSESEDPRKGPDAWARITSKGPLDVQTTSALDFVWYSRKPNDKVPRDRFATVATTTVNLPAGQYWVRTVSDDGIRVFVDGKQVVTDWTWHPATPNDAKVRVDAGPHDFRVEHFEIDGYAQLQFWLEPGTR